MGHRYVEEKKKLDPVGQEDGDVDNDGDKDDSDEYLKKRRSAISKAMKGKKDKDVKINKADKIEVNPEMSEKKLTPAELKKREEIAKSIERDNPDMPMDKKMAIATATAKRVAESTDIEENIGAPQTAAHRRAQMGSRYSDIMKKRQADNEKARQALKDPDHNPAWANSKSKNEETVSEVVHPDHVTLHPHKTDKTKYTVGQVGKNVKGRLNPGEHVSDSEVDDLHDMGMKVKHERKPYNEAKDFDQKFRDRIKFSMSKSKAVQNYMKKRRDDRDARHAKQDPAAVKKNYGPAVIPPGTAYKKASKRGMNPSQAANAVSTAFKNRAKRGAKLPESVEIEEAREHEYSRAVKALKDYANKNGGIDKADFHTAAKHLDNLGKSGLMQKGNHLAKYNNHVRGLDTDVRDRIQMTLRKHGIMEGAQLDELSPETHKSYQARAYTDAARGMAKKRMGTMSAKDAYDKERKRYKGIDTSKYLNRKQHGVKSEANEDLPFEPDAPKKDKKNSDGTTTQPMSRARQLARQAAQSVAKRKKMGEEKEGGDSVRRADVKMIRVKNPDGSVSMRKQRPEVKVEEK
jgi:hypothetical protein